MSTLHLKTDQKTFDLPTLHLSHKSDYFHDLLLSQPPNSFLQVSVPFTLDLNTLLTWLSNQDPYSLISSVSTLESLFQIYSLARLFKIKPYTNLRNILLSIQFTIHSFDFNTNLTQALHKDQIDLHFLLQTMKNLSFSANLNKRLIKLVLVFEWLGEKTCQSDEDLRKLQESEEIKRILSILARENLEPTFQELRFLVKLFPNTCKFLGLV